MKYAHFLLDWGDTLMKVDQSLKGPMYLWPRVQSVDHADKLLQCLSSFGKCYVASNALDSSSNEILMALHRVNLDQYITKVYTAKDCGYKKHNPEYFQSIIKDIGNQKTIVMIGDNEFEDIVCANNAGIDAIWFNPFDLQSEYNIPSYASLHDIIAYLAKQ